MGEVLYPEEISRELAENSERGPEKELVGYTEEVGFLIKNISQIEKLDKPKDKDLEDAAEMRAELTEKLQDPDEEKRFVGNLLNRLASNTEKIVGSEGAIDKETATNYGRREVVLKVHFEDRPGLIDAYKSLARELLSADQTDNFERTWVGTSGESAVINHVKPHPELGVAIASYAQDKKQGDVLIFAGPNPENFVPVQLKTGAKDYLEQQGYKLGFAEDESLARKFAQAKALKLGIVNRFKGSDVIDSRGKFTMLGELFMDSDEFGFKSSVFRDAAKELGIRVA